MKTPFAPFLHLICTALAAALLLVLSASAGDLAVRVIDRSPDVRNLDTTDTLKWFADESIDYTVRPRRGKEAVAIPGDAVATWIIADPATGTNYLSAVAASQTSNSVTFHLPMGGAALPEDGDWVSFVSLMQGTNFLGVIDRTRAECLWSPYTSAAALVPTNPLPELLRQFATTSYVANAIEYAITNLPPAGIDYPIVTNAAFTNFAFPRGITMEGDDIPDITADGLPSFNFSGLVRYRYANSPWLSLVGYPCVGLFGLHGSFQVNQSGPYVVGGLGFAGSGKRLEISDGELTFGGEPIGGGVPAIEAGRGISVAVTTDETAVVSAALTAGHGITLSTNAQNTALVLAVPRDIDFDDVTIRGDLIVEGVEYKTTTIYNQTNVNVGVRTNYYTEDVYTTNRVYQHVYVVERTTQYVAEVVTVGGNVDHSRAEWVKEPSFTIDNAATNAPVLIATGEWDFTAASINFGTNFPDLSDGGVVQPMIWLTNGTIALQPDVQIYAATPESGTAFDVDLSALDAPPNCAITFEMLLDLGASVSNVTFMSTNTLSWLEGDAPAIPQGARSILVFRSYDLTNWIANLQGSLP